MTPIATPRSSVARADALAWGLWLALAGLVGYAFWGQRVEGPLTTFQWLTAHWHDVSHYSHGPLIPLIATFLLWWNVSHQHREQKDWRGFWRPTQVAGGVMGLWFMSNSFGKEAELTVYVWVMRLLPVLLAWQVWSLRRWLVGDESWTTRRGLAAVTGAMALYYAGVKAAQPRVAVIGFVVLLYGLAWALTGPAGRRALFFPITFLFLMVPLNFLEERVAVPLRHLMAFASTGLLNLLGIETVQRGTAILSNVFHFDVANPCSGIQSLMALTTVTAAYAYVTQVAQWKRWVLFLSALPLAVLGNLARVTSIALVAQAYGQELATKAYHDWSGFLVFAVALAAMVGFGWLLDLPYRQLWQRWTKSTGSKLSTA